MTVGTATVYSPAATDVITAAYQIMAVINEDEVPTAGQMKVGMSTLNSMMKELEATGIHVWTEEEAILFLQQYQRRYLLGGTTTDHCCDASSWSFSALNAAAAAGASTVQVVSAAGISSGDNFGVVTNSGAAFWTTVNGAPVGTTVTLTTPLPTACNAGNFTFDYPPAAQLLRPLRVPFARRLQYAQNPLPGLTTAPDWGGIITPISPMMSRREFFDLPQPNNPGLVSNAYYNPARDQGEMWVWNVATDANFGMRFTYYRPIHNFDNVANSPDLPDEWGNALKWNLARELGPRYSIAAERWDRITVQADIKLELVKGFDHEPESVYFGRSSAQTRG